MSAHEQTQQEITDKAAEPLLWPVWDASAPIMQRFGDNDDIYKRFGQDGHNGIDIGVTMYTPVRAVKDGIVRFAGNGAAESLMGGAAGECILIRHADGTQAGYAHLSAVYVQTGATVKAGDVIALSGMSGATTGPHLHIEILGWPLDMRNGYMGRVDPLPLLGKN